MSKKVNFNIVQIVATERCNLACEHCMRYETDEDVKIYSRDMDRSTVDAFFRNVGSIIMLMFTGGEPLLNMDIIEYVADKIIAEDINVMQFGIITNGTIMNERVVRVFKRLAQHLKKKQITEYHVCILKISRGYHKNDAQKACDYYTKAFEQYKEYIQVYVEEEELHSLSWSGRAKNLKDVFYYADTPCHRIEYLEEHPQVIKCAMQLGTSGMFTINTNGSFRESQHCYLGNVHERDIASMIHDWQLNTPLTCKEACQKKEMEMLLSTDQWKQTEFYETEKNCGISDDEIKERSEALCKTVLQQLEEREKTWFKLREYYPYLKYEEIEDIYNTIVRIAEKKETTEADEEELQATELAADVMNAARKNIDSSPLLKFLQMFVQQ